MKSKMHALALGFVRVAPAIAVLLSRIARLPEGVVVLPGLSLANSMPDEEWDALGPDERGRAEETHPQFHLKLLLQRIGVARGEVRPWPSSAPTGSSAAVSAALGRLDIGGTLVLAGSVTPGPALAVDPETVVRQWLTITGVHNYEPRHLHQAVDFLDRTREQYPWEALVVSPVPLKQIASALRSPPSGKLRTAICP